ncbi:LysR family transcriptional regulator [Pendulispora brunnea]|uniref:LysR family transcriptional regulator n=1 Tax=Pendulispora brunnea TaxID=2905690 RepID=A0ABZ2JVK4_9BACT
MPSEANITFAQLLAFIAVVEEQRFTAAARRLGMTQSAISQAVLSLEQSLGVALLSRGRDRISPSAIGLEVLANARDALNAVARIREQCASMAGLDHGILRIGSIPSAAARVLPEPLRTFRTHYPGVQLLLLEGTDEEVSEWVHRGTVEVGLTASWEGELGSEVVAEDEFVVVVGHNHRLATANAASIRDVADEPFIMWGCSCEGVIRGLFSHAEVSAPQVVFTVTSIGALLEMVGHGLGVTIVPSWCLPANRNRLRVLPLRPVHRRTLYAITRTEALSKADEDRQAVRLSPAATAFLTFLRQGARPPIGFDENAESRPPGSGDVRGGVGATRYG